MGLEVQAIGRDRAAAHNNQASPDAASALVARVPRQPMVAHLDAHGKRAHARFGSTWVRSAITGYDAVGLGGGGASGKAMNAWSSASGSFMRPAFQSAAAWASRSCDDDTKFQ